MELKVLVTTPKGQAKRAEGNLRKFLLGFKRPNKIYTNEEDTEILWIVSGDPRLVHGIHKKVALFHTVTNMILSKGAVKKIIQAKLKKEKMQELLDMLLKETHVEVVNNEEAEELAKDKNSAFYLWKHDNKSK